MTTVSKKRVKRDRGFAFTLAAFILLLSMASAYFILSEFAMGGRSIMVYDSSSDSSVFRSILIQGSASASLNANSVSASKLFIESAIANASSIVHLGITFDNLAGNASGESEPSGALIFNLSSSPSDEDLPIELGNAAFIQISTSSYSYREELTPFSVSKGISKPGVFVILEFLYRVIDNGTMSEPRLIDVYVDGNRANLIRTSFCSYAVRFNIFPESEAVVLTAMTESGIRISCAVRL